MATRAIHTDEPDPHHVHTRDDGKVDKEVVTISGSAGEQVTWFSDNGGTVLFKAPEGSPFENDKFPIPAGGSVSSGPARPNAEHRDYKYTVVGKTGVYDPKVIINP
jgi:hypothetical protein